MRVSGVFRTVPVVVAAATVTLCGAALLAGPAAVGAEDPASTPPTPASTSAVSGDGPAVSEDGPAVSEDPPAPDSRRPSAHQGPEYTGSRACRTCHLREYRSWQETAHANAFELLAPGARPEAKEKVNLQPGVDYRANEACLPCHTVGYKEPGGFVSLEETPELVGVGCENCHGAGGDYIADDVMGRDNLDHSFEEVIAAGLIYPVPEATCGECHGASETPFNPELFPEYAIEYDRETLGAPTHEHPPLRRQHGPLPEGVMFQPEYEPGSSDGIPHSP